MPTRGIFRAAVIEAIRATLKQWDAQRAIEDMLGFDFDDLNEALYTLSVGADPTNVVVSDEQLDWLIEYIDDNRNPDNPVVPQTLRGDS